MRTMSNLAPQEKPSHLVDPAYAAVALALANDPEKMEKLRAALARSERDKSAEAAKELLKIYKSIVDAGELQR